MSAPQKTIIFIVLVLFLTSSMLASQTDDSVWGLSPKNLQGPVSVYRFFNHVRGGHLYTISEIERDFIIDNLPEWNYEGTKFRVYEDITAGTAAAYRFFNTITGIHLYTISEIERDNIINNYPEWNYEGVKFYVSESLADNTTAVYRFFNHVRGGHLYTISEIERDVVMQLPEWTFEGVPFYVYPIAPAPVPKTGQATSYRDGDDGYYQMGVEWPDPRFTDHGNGTVTDNLTGLMWTQNANMDGQKDWNDAIDWCNNLTHGGYSDWRLPNVRELFSLIDISKFSPALPEGHPFTNVTWNRYWSSTTHAINAGSAWIFRVAWTGWSWVESKSNNYIVWPVRGHSTGTIKVHKTGQTISYRDGDDGYYQMGVEWPNPRFTDHGNGTVTDELTGLMWTQNANMALNFPNEDYPPNAYGGLIWNNAIDYCNALHHGGHGDWRLHNVRELESLIDYSKNSPAMLEGHPFADVKNYYWSSTTCAINSSKAWGLDIRYGFMETGYKASSIYVWPVRDGH